MTKRCRPLVSTLAVLLVITLAANARPADADTFRLSRVFSDGMVLQRDQPVRIWGRAEPGARVTAEIGGYAVPAIADGAGRWEAVLPPFEAGGPRTLTVESGARIAVRDVLFGDVWLASGQSNMEWALGSGVNDGDREIAKADYPKIRFFIVPNVVSPEASRDLESGEWQTCSPRTAPRMSAVAYFFARHLHREKGVPIGIVDATWGGTPAEAWTSAEINLTLPHYRERMTKILESDRSWEREVEENEARNAAKWALIRDLDKAKTYGVHLPDHDDSSWATVRLPNEDPLSDIVWLRRTFQLDEVKERGYELVVGAFENVNAIFVNGQQVYEKKGDAQVREVSLSEGVLKAGGNVIAIRALNDWNNRTFVGTPGPMVLRHEGDPLVVNLEGQWRFSNTIEPPMPEVVRYSHLPSFLYNGMIAPIAGYTLKGAIWYQGESNAAEAHAYRTLFPAMIQDWRVRWRQGSWPFLFVQLANWRARKPQPAASDWAELREAQLMTLALPDTGMAVTIDIGEAEDIHPRNKQDVGERLALAARKVAYGEVLVHSGPIYRSNLINREGLPASPFRTDTWPGITE